MTKASRRTSPDYAVSTRRCIALWPQLDDESVARMAFANDHLQHPNCKGQDISFMAGSRGQRSRAHAASCPPTELQSEHLRAVDDGRLAAARFAASSPEPSRSNLRGRRGSLPGR